jgi:hypothetical protein
LAADDRGLGVGWLVSGVRLVVGGDAEDAVDGRFRAADRFSYDGVKFLAVKVLNALACPRLYGVWS